MAELNVALNQDDDHLSEAIINFAGGGSSTIVAGVAGKIIRVYKYFVVAATPPTSRSTMAPSR